MPTATHHDGVVALLPEIRARRDEIEHGRRLPADLVDDLGRAGVFRVALPRDLGGDELDPPDQLRLIEVLSAADGSTGWCAMIALGNGVFAGSMPDRGAKEVFADPARPTAASIAPTGTARAVDGGLRVSGRWRFASGVDHASWVLVGCSVEPADVGAAPAVVHVWVPAAHVRVHDTWHASGLRGTGSNDVEITDAFVPEELVVWVFDLARHRPEPLYQMPVLSLFAPHIAAVGLGVARAALDEFVELAGSKVPTFSSAPLAQRAVAQVELAKAEATLRAARSSLYDAIDDVWQTVVAGRVPTARQHALCRLASVHASHEASSVARTASVLAGGTSVYATSPLQRHARDADAVTHHLTQSPQVWEECGRVLLGLDSPLM